MSPPKVVQRVQPPRDFNLLISSKEPSTLSTFIPLHLVIPQLSLTVDTFLFQKILKKWRRSQEIIFEKVLWNEAKQSGINRFNDLKIVKGMLKPGESELDRMERDTEVENTIEEKLKRG